MRIEARREPGFSVLGDRSPRLLWHRPCKAGSAATHLIRCCLGGSLGLVSAPLKSGHNAPSLLCASSPYLHHTLALYFSIPSGFCPSKGGFETRPYANVLLVATFGLPKHNRQWSHSP